MADHVAVFEALHGSAPRLAGLDKVNPGSMLFSGVMMLEYIGWHEAADLISHAYPEVVQSGIVTYDFALQMDGATEVSTSRFADALIEQIESGIDLSAKREAERRVVERARAEREARRVSEPYTAMAATGAGLHQILGNVAEFCRDYYLGRSHVPRHGDGLRVLEATPNQLRVFNGGTFLGRAPMPLLNRVSPETAMRTIGVRPIRRLLLRTSD